MSSGRARGPPCRAGRVASRPRDARRDQRHGWHTCPRRDPQGSLRPHLGRAAHGLEGRGAALPGVGDLPPQGVAGEPRPDLRLPDQRLVRPGDPAVRRRRRVLGPGGQRLQLRRRPRRAPVVRRVAAAVVVHPGLAPRALAARRRDGVRRHRGRRAVQVHRRRCRLDRAVRPAQARHRPPVAAGRGRHVPAHDPPAPDRRRPPLHRDLRGRRLPHRRRRRDLAADQQGPAVRRDPRPGLRGRPLRPQPGDAPGRTRTCCTCRSTGTSCAPRTVATPGRRSAATCRPTSASRSRCTPTSRRPSTSCRSPATPTTSRPRASCGSTAAAPVATSGRP